jgi:hypothetical protein
MPLLVLFIYGIYLAVQWPLADKDVFGYISFGHKSVDISELAVPQKYIRIHHKLPATLGHDPTVGRCNGKPRKHHR